MSFSPPPNHTVNADYSVTVSYPQIDEDTCYFAIVQLEIIDESNASNIAIVNITESETTLPATYFDDCKSYTLRFTLIDAKLTVSPATPTTYEITNVGPADIGEVLMRSR